MKAGSLVFLLAGLLVLCAVVPSASGLERPGVCPFFPAVVKPPCVKQCRTDEDCPLPRKCCPKMCSMVCLKPNRY